MDCVPCDAATHPVSPCTQGRQPVTARPDWWVWGTGRRLAMKLAVSARLKSHTVNTRQGRTRGSNQRFRYRRVNHARPS